MSRKSALQNGGLVFEKHGHKQGGKRWWKTVWSCIIGSSGFSIFGVWSIIGSQSQGITASLASVLTTLFIPCLVSSSPPWKCSNNLLKCSFNIQWVWPTLCVQTSQSSKITKVWFQSKIFLNWKACTLNNTTKIGSVKGILLCM